MKYFKCLTYILLISTFVTSVIGSTSTLICDGNLETRECQETEDAESHEKLEIDEISSYSFVSSRMKFNIYTVEFNDPILSFKDIHFEIIMPPPDFNSYS